MGLTEAQRQAIWSRAGGLCECTMAWCSRHRPGIRCGHPLSAHYWAPVRIDLLSPGAATDDYVPLCGACLEETTYALGLSPVPPVDE